MTLGRVTRAATAAVRALLTAALAVAFLGATPGSASALPDLSVSVESTPASAAPGARRRLRGVRAPGELRAGDGRLAHHGLVAESPDPRPAGGQLHRHRDGVLVAAGPDAGRHSGAGLDHRAGTDRAGDLAAPGSTGGACPETEGEAQAEAEEAGARQDRAARQGVPRKRCVRSRKLRLRLRQPGGAARSKAQIYIGKRRIKTVKGSALRKSVSLSRLPKKGRYKLLVVLTLRDGGRLSGRRTLRACSSSRR